MECGHGFNDLLHIYTVDQLWLFYEKAIIIRRKQQYEDTLAFAHCMSLPLGGKEANKNFEKFLKSLLPDSFRKAVYQHQRKDMLRRARPDKVFKQLGLPIATKPKSKDKG